MKLRFAKLLGLIATFVFSLFLAFPVLAANPLSISYDYSRGLFPAGTSFYLHTGTSVYQDWSDSKRIRVNFTVTQKEMDSLYSYFKRYSFSGIEVSKIKAYDRGGDVITLVANNKTTVKSNAGQSIIKSSFSKWRYDKISNNLKTFIKKKLTNYYQTFPLDLEANTDYGVRVAVDDVEVQMHASKNTVALLPGQHTILVGLYDGNDNIITAETLAIDIPDKKLAHIRVDHKDVFILAE